MLKRKWTGYWGKRITQHWGNIEAETSEKWEGAVYWKSKEEISEQMEQQVQNSQGGNKPNVFKEQQGHCSYSRVGERKDAVGEVAASGSYTL